MERCVQSGHSFIREVKLGQHFLRFFCHYVLYEKKKISKQRIFLTLLGFSGLDEC